MDWKAVYGDFSDLPKSEQHSLFQAIKDTLFPEPKEDIANMVGEIREVRFSSGLACVHCGSVNIKRNDKYRSRQRYICKDCGKSFNDMTASPISGAHHPHKWLKYFQMMVDGVTLPKIAEELEIHVSNRKPRKRGGKAKKRGISKEQISVVVAHDRNGNVLSKVAGRERITADEIDQTLNGCLEKEVVLCIDSATNYKAFAKQKGIPHEIINAIKGIHVKKVYFISNMSIPITNV